MPVSLFGTDGVRGIANDSLTPGLVFRLSRSVAVWFRRKFGGDGRAVVVVGRDTRRSGDMFTAAVIAGVTSTGADVLSLGVVPTPAVAHAVANSSDAVGGIVVSASHNPAAYNGIKLFGGEGRKLSLDDEAEIEGLLEQCPGCLPRGTSVGVVHHGAQEVAAYLHDLACAPGHSLDGIRILLDCANGAGFRLGPAAFRDAGAVVTTLFDEPDGFNINGGCGSTRPEVLRAAMLAGDYDLGISLDGDADRVVAVSREGQILDGDDILYILARDLKERNLLPGNRVVTTIVNNRGLDASLKTEEVEVVHCSVGDREIMYTMQREGASLGGETSGHILMEDFSVSGDAILAALMVTSVLVRTKRSVGALLEGFTKFPQVLVNVPVRDREALLGDQVIATRIEEVEGLLGDEGRVLVRASGTEPVVRVMVECPGAGEAERMARDLADVVSERLS